MASSESLFGAEAFRQVPGQLTLPPVAHRVTVLATIATKLLEQGWTPISVGEYTVRVESPAMTWDEADAAITRATHEAYA